MSWDEVDRLGGASAYLRCYECGARYSLDETVLVCIKCGGILDLVRAEVGHRIAPTTEGLVRSLWRYADFLPVSDPRAIVSLGEGLTPTVRAETYGRAVGVKDLLLKLEFLNPTGSFKDRGTTVNVSRMRELGITSVLDDSSGNAGSSLAAYSAAAGMRCRLYAPANASKEKLVQAQMYGATIIRVEGTRANVAARAMEAWKRGEAFYASHALSPYFIEGTKTVAFEVAEEASKTSLPNHMVFPVGGGSLLLGAWKGFTELRELGMIDEVPKLHCVQSDRCDPVVRAFKAGATEITAVPDEDTVAGGIRIANPVRGRQVLEAVRGSGGTAQSVSDSEIMEQQSNVARMAGIFAEPTSCAALAGLARLCREGIISDDDVVAVPVTGSGLKDVATAAEYISR